MHTITHTDNTHSTHQHINIYTQTQTEGNTDNRHSQTQRHTSPLLVFLGTLRRCNASPALEPPPKSLLVGEEAALFQQSTISFIHHGF